MLAITTVEIRKPMANNTNVLKTLTRAIMEKRCVAIRREGQTRLVPIEPHALYSDAKHGIILDFYQPPITTFDTNSKGAWDSVTWRNITAAFWLNTSFEPRLKRGFNPAQEKYRTGLLAIIDTHRRPNNEYRLWEQIETSIERHLKKYPDSGAKH